MPNFLEETCRTIIDSNHTTEDIIFIGSEHSGYYCNWEEFESLADFEYNNKEGNPGVAVDLTIIFLDNGALHRHLHKGLRIWAYYPYHDLKCKRKIKTLQNKIGWENLEKIHGTDCIEEVKRK